MSLIIYLDESGDLGWNFDAPFLNGGSSRFLTIGALCVPSEKKYLPKRVIRKLYDKFGWDPTVEKKWAAMDQNERKEFAERALKLRDANADIYFRAITVKKVNVMQHIRKDSNKLYNYMIGLLLLPLMATQAEVLMVPDLRSIKVESGNSLHDYLQVDLWFVNNVKTILKTDPKNSQFCLGIQFTDMLSGLVRTHWEQGETTNYNILAPRIGQKCLYFK